MILTPDRIRRLYRRFDARPLRTQVISVAEAVEVFRRLGPYPTAFLFTRTEPYELYKNHGQGELCVVKRREVILNQPYAEAVNEQRKKEGKKPNFEPAGRPWGESLGLPFVFCLKGGHTPNLYVSALVRKNLGVEFFRVKDMSPVDRELLKDYFKPYRPNARQGVKKEVKYRDWNLRSILGIGIQGPRGGERLLVIDIQTLHRSAGPQPKSPVRVVAKQEARKAGLMPVERPSRKTAKSTRGAR